MLKEKQTENNLREKEAGSVEIEFYTDPLCCWSWGFEPQWRRLRYEYSGKIKWRYRMSGLLPNWQSYNDPVNNVSKPIQMGPVWLEAKYASGMPIDDKVWFHDPPASSYPACMAVKCAGLQSPEAAEMYLRRVREAVMLQGKNIAKAEVLLDVAKSLSEEEQLDYPEFEAQLGSEEARNAFEEDLRQVRYYGITRYPALTIAKPGEAGLLIVGYRPYEALVKTLQKIAPVLEPVQQLKSPEDYHTFWSGALDREVEEVLRLLFQQQP